jgi:hypothetical protein
MRVFSTVVVVQPPSSSDDRRDGSLKPMPQGEFVNIDAHTPVDLTISAGS